MNKYLFLIHMIEKKDISWYLHCQYVIFRLIISPI